jgi:co-chaperonin GroES (HSP10)
VNIKPLRGHCLVEVLRENKIKAGIAIPETAKAKDDVGRLPGLTAKVWRLGPWLVKKNGRAVLPEFAPGDRVYVNQYAGKKVKHAGRAFRLVSIEDVLAVLP